MWSSTPGPAILRVHREFTVSVSRWACYCGVVGVQNSDESGLVLVVEDEALIAVALQDDLEDAGYSVAGPFSTCAAALQWLTGEKPDVAVLDAVLKDGPCKDVALKLTSLGVPFIVYSGYSEDLTSLGSLQGGLWVEKPARGEVLLDAVAKVRKGEIRAA